MSKSAPAPRPKLIEPRAATRPTRWLQHLLGVACYLLLWLPYVREMRGAEVLDPPGRRLFLINHVSLLDTPLVGAALWRSGRHPILVLGDLSVWRNNLLRSWLSARVGFLIDRDGPTKARLRELRAFGSSVTDFDLLMFPEGTRGDGRSILPVQPGVSFVARAAKVPIVPVFVEGMAQLSSKTGGWHPWRALRRVKIHFGEAIEPETYLALDRSQLVEMVEQRLAALIPEHLRQPRDTGAGSG